MLWLALAISGAGLCCGHLLFRRMTETALDCAGSAAATISIVIPARNEAVNLPRLLESLKDGRERVAEIIVVDDESTDETASVARTQGAAVLPSAPLPDGWTGKCWACWQGAAASTSDAILFLDADTYFLAGGLHRFLSSVQDDWLRTAFSVLPYHAVQQPYEQLSLFFNLLMAAGAGGFSGFDPPKLFGQSLLIGRELYLKSGGHRSVRKQALENLHLATHIVAAGGHVRAAIGRGVLEMRLFPNGIAELRAGWERGSSAGADATAKSLMALSILWLSGAVTAVLALCLLHGRERLLALGLYILFAAQIQRVARRIGAFHWVASWAYPVPLMFYFAIHASSEWKRRVRKKVEWKGRQL